MLTRIEEAKQKWGGAHTAIDNWLAERKQLLVQYCELAGLPPYERDIHAVPQKDSIESFCEILMDYVSAGHFEVYDKIVEECEKNHQNLSLTEEIYPKISVTTDEALNFNDVYADISDEQTLTSFDVHLSNLGQQMEVRFELEDRLIHTLHTDHL